MNGYEFNAILSWLVLLATEVYLGIYVPIEAIALPILGGVICAFNLGIVVAEVVRRAVRRRRDYVVGYDSSRKRA